MRVFVIAAMGSALLAGCAPFEHGHYTEDVAYRNTVGDPPGTPLVYQAEPENRAQYSPTAYAAIQSEGRSWNRNHRFASNRYDTYSAPTVASVQPVQYSQPLAYSAPVSYTQPATQSYVAQAQPIQYSQPVVQQTYTPQPVLQQRIIPQPAVQNTFVAAAPSYQSPTIATTYGGTGTKFDAEGYAICDIPWPQHAAHQKPHFNRHSHPYQSRF